MRPFFCVYVSLLALISSVAYGEIKVGSSATYRNTFVSESGTIVMTNKDEVLEINAKENKALVRTTERFEGEAEETETQEWLPLDELMDQAQGTSILNACTSKEIGGKTETVQVPAGNIKACKLQNIEEAMWIGSVTFGIVKATGSFEMGEEDAPVIVQYLVELVAHQ